MRVFQMFQCSKFWRTSSAVERESWGAFFSMKGGKGGERGGKGKRVKVKLGSVLLYEGGERGRKRGEREEGQSAN